MFLLLKSIRDVIQSYADKIDMLNTIGTMESSSSIPSGILDSPMKSTFEMHTLSLNCPDESISSSELMNIEEESRMYSKHEISNYGFDAKVEITKNLTAEIMVLNYDRKVLA